MKKLLFTILSLLLLVSCGSSNKSVSQRYEIPTSTSGVPEVYLERMGYTVSFNPQTNIPNFLLAPVVGSVVPPEPMDFDVN